MATNTWMPNPSYRFAEVVFAAFPLLQVYFLTSTIISLSLIEVLGSATYAILLFLFSKEKLKWVACLRTVDLVPVRCCYSLFNVLQCKRVTACPRHFLLCFTLNRQLIYCKSIVDTPLQISLCFSLSQACGSACHVVKLFTTWNCSYNLFLIRALQPNCFE